MGIRKRGNAYVLDYYVNGRRVRETIGTSKKQAENILSKRKTDIIENKYFDIRKKHRILFEDFAKEFLELHSKVNKRPRVARRDFFLMNRLGTHFNGRYLSEITPQSIERYKAERITLVAPATVNRELACLKCMFNKAIEWSKAYDNPVRKVKLFKEKNQRTRYLEQNEIPKFIESCSDHLKPIVIVAVFTGMRKSEILNLKWEDIDFKRGIIYLLHTKNNEKREVLMNDIVSKALSSIERHKDSPYVFLSHTGKPYTNVRKSFETALKKCDIINFRFHDLRHTFASQLVMMGIDIKTVQELMGHKTIEMTLRYSHLSPDHKKKAVDTLGKKIGTFWSQMPETAKDAEDVHIDN
jgi:integrase